MTGVSPFSPPPEDELERVATRLGAWAAERIFRVPAESVETKRHGADLVTTLDRDIEREVRGAIAASFPEHRFCGEEDGDSGPAGARYTWYCDPIDGTTNYANGLAWCSFSLCCWDEIGPLLGIVVDPFRRELFIARRNGGAQLAHLDQEFRIGSARQSLTSHPGVTLAGSVVTMEWLAHLPWPGMATTIAALAAQECTVRIMGSSALSIVQAAAGRAAGCIIGAYDPIDDSAAALIAAEAGALVCDSRGDLTVRPDNSGILIAGRSVAAALLAAWQSGVHSSRETSLLVDVSREL